MLDARQIKADFPLFSNHQDLVYLDNAATSQKPQVVIDALTNFYTHTNANVHRGLYPLSEQASEAYEQARATLATFVGASSPTEIVFTAGTTASLNLLAETYARAHVGVGDEIIVSDFEHHSNLLPWQRVAQTVGARLVIVESDEQGMISDEQWQAKLSQKTKLVAIAHASNVLGTIMDIKHIASMVHAVGAVLVVDGAQAAPHLPVRVQDLDCDFYVVSGHKMLGPMGVGVLYAKQQHLASMQPYQLGGGMIESVTLDEVQFADFPAKFEAGTPPVAQAIGLAAASEYLNQVGLEAIHEHEVRLNELLLQGLSAIPQVKLLGTAPANARTGLVSFVVEGVHAHDLSDYLGKHAVAVRAGFHCAMPLHQRRHCSATLRVSHYCYTSQEDIEQFLVQLKKAIAYYG